MKTLKSLSIIMLVSFCILSSCNREYQVSPNENLREKVMYNDGVSSRDGIPIYENWEQFYNHLKSTNNTSKLADFERKHTYSSLLGEFIRTNNDSTYVSTSSLLYKTGKELSINIINYGLAALINKEGFAIVGAGLFKFKGADVYSMPLEGLNIDKGISTLNLADPISANNKVHVSTFKDLTPTLSKHIQSTPASSKSSTVNGCNGGVCNGTYYQMVASVLYGTSSYESYSCPGGLVYDEDSRGYVCDQPVVYDGTVYYGSVAVKDDVYKILHGTQRQRANQGSIVSFNRVSGSVDYQINGTSKTDNFNYSTGDDYIYQNVNSYSTFNTPINYDVYSFSFTFESAITYLDGSMITTISQ